MAITTLLAVHSAEEPVESINSIVALAGKMDVHLNLVVFGVLKSIPTSFYGGLPDQYLAEVSERAVNTANERAKEAFALIEEASISVSVIVEHIDKGTIAETMSGHALFADMACFAHDSILRHSTTTSAFNGVLFEAGLPVLILGTDANPPLPVKRVVIAWDGEPEAAKAIRESLPLLHDTQDIHIVMVDPEADSSESDPGNAMATLLTRHGLKVTVDQIPSAGKDVADAILQHAVDKDAELIIMGAYGHSRLHQRLLGGTTREVLSNAKLPVLMAH